MQLRCSYVRRDVFEQYASMGFNFEKTVAERNHPVFELVKQQNEVMTKTQMTFLHSIRQLKERFAFITVNSKLFFKE